MIEFDVPKPPRSGDDVARLAQVSKRYGAKVVYSDFELLIRRRERWCVMGVNGASVKLGYFAQHAMEVLDGDKTVIETLEMAYPKASLGSLRTVLGAFGFSGDDSDKRVRILSGGEKARLVLARMLYDPPNFLVFDEPTNHLDMATKEMLVEALREFEGTMLFVSHDRTFLRALSNRVLELGDPKKPRVYGGGYSEYVSQVGYEAPGIH